MKNLLIVFLSFCILLASCSKKQQAQAASSNIGKPATASAANNKTTVKKITQPPLPKVLTLDDRAAKKSVDGRLYYDLEGHRYWRNYDDGKYYQFNKSMFSNPAFKPH
jgi:hypothetical protein